MRALKAVRQHFTSYQLKSGVFHFYRGEHGPAAEYLTRVLTEEADVAAADRRAALYYLVQTRIGAAEEYEDAGEFERAIEEYRSALAVMPTYPDVQYKLGLALRHVGRDDDAIEAFRRALGSNPAYVDALVALGFTLLEQERPDDARASFNQALEARTSAMSGRVRSAEQALASGRNEVARDIYLDAFQTEVGLFQQALRRGLDCLRAEKWDDAIEELQVAAGLCPRFADVHNYLGVALAESGRQDDAVEAFRASVDINPAYAAAWLNLAYTADALGDEELAREALEPVLGREPDNDPARRLAEQLESAREPGTRKVRPVQDEA
jgi:tetratricopeptide (TPR) repeat protein